MHSNKQHPRVMVNHDVKEPLVAESAAEVVDLSLLTDAQGRVLEIKAPDILMQARFERLFGEDNANYRLIMGALTWVRAINGEAVFQPTSVLAYEALLQRLGDQALVALVKRIGEIQEQSKLTDDVRSAVKKS